jgi:hypothetical protein
MKKLEIPVSTRISADWAQASKLQQPYGALKIVASGEKEGPA